MARTAYGYPGIYNATPITLTDGEGCALAVDVNGYQKVSLATLIAGEDVTNDVLKTEQRYSYSLVTADTLVKTGSGVLHCVTIAQNDAAPTAGTIDILDNTSAGSTPKIFSWTLTTAVFYPFTIFFDCAFATGLYVDFTTTADVNVTVSYR